MDARLQRRFRIGDYEVRPLEGRVAGPSGSHHVQPKAMEVLVCLAESPGELLERETLLERVWGTSATSQDALTRCISDLRHHFDDHTDAVQYIQTIPKRGYRLVAPVEFYEDSGEFPSAYIDDPSTADDRSSANSLLALWADLKRRNVVRVGLAYLVAAWLLLQVADLLFDALFLPKWTVTLLVALLALGFPIALIMAWVFQVTPDGVVLDVGRQPKIGARLRRNVDIAIIGGLVLIVALLVHERTIDTEPEVTAATMVPGSASPVSSIAVLRFLNIGGETYFADGLCEELLDRLANLRELGVAARTSSWALSDGDVDVPTIAERLEVDYVLEGSVRQQGDRIRVTAQLNDGVTGKHVWSRSYDRKLTAANFFETQTEIARQVVSLLKVSLSPESEQKMVQVPDTSFDALDLYLQGQAQFRLAHSDESLAAATDLFERSIEFDPRFALAYSGLCDAQLGLYIIDRKTETFEAAERACHRALTLDNALPKVVASLGSLYLFSGQYDKAEEALRRAIAESPNLIDAYADLGETLEYQGRVDEARQVFLAMATRQPGYWYAHNALGNFLFRQAEYTDALTAWQRVTEIEPDMALGFNNVASAHYMLGDFDAAADAYQRSVALEPYVDNFTNLGLAYFYAGQYEEAARMQHKAAELRPEDVRVWGRLGNVYHYSGRPEEAEAYYRRAVELIEAQLIINPNDLRLNRFLAVYSAQLGDTTAANEAIQRAIDLNANSGGVWFDAAKVEYAAGNTELALEHLARSLELGYPRHLLNADPEFFSLHDDARFALVAR